MKVELIAHTPNPEKVIEIAARTSYKSFKKMNEKSHIKLIKHLIKLGHLSVLEHAYATFKVEGISRSCSHQLVRHRLASFTQESQRYVRSGSSIKENIDFVIPESIKRTHDDEEKYKDGITPYDKYISIMNSLFSIYNEFIEMGIPKEDARFLLPNAATTSLVISANFREWLHIIKLRVSLEAQWEIRQLSILFWKELYKIAPTVFDLSTFACDKFKSRIFIETIKEGG